MLISIRLPFLVTVFFIYKASPNPLSRTSRWSRESLSNEIQKIVSLETQTESQKYDTLQIKTTSVNFKGEGLSLKNELQGTDYNFPILHRSILLGRILSPIDVGESAWLRHIRYVPKQNLYNEYIEEKVPIREEIGPGTMRAVVNATWMTYRPSTSSKPDYVKDFFASWEAMMLLGVTGGCVCCFLFACIVTRSGLGHNICGEALTEKCSLERTNADDDDTLSNGKININSHLEKDRRTSGFSFTAEIIDRFELEDDVFETYVDHQEWRSLDNQEEKRHSGGSQSNVSLQSENNRSLPPGILKRQMSVDTIRTTRALSSITEAQDEVIAQATTNSGIKASNESVGSEFA